MKTARKPTPKRGNRRQRVNSMRRWIETKAKKTPADTAAFFDLFVSKGVDLQTARNLAMAKDGTPFR